jgi:cardiolipin synthase A/B
VPDANRKKVIRLLFAVLLLCSCASVKWGFYRTSLTLDDPEFAGIISSVSDEPLVGGNKVDVLINGDEILPSMLDAVSKAKTCINFETYIFREDRIGRLFASALIERARAGVKVRLLVDHFGYTLSEPLENLMREAGIRLCVFNPWNWLHMGKGNIRTHRKILVVDGAIAFTGGVGIDSRWSGNAQDSEHWRETQARLEGPVVAQFQSLFLENWIRETGEEIPDKDLFPEPRMAGNALAGAVGRMRPRNWSNVREMFLLTLAASRRYFYLNAAYFSPDPDCMKALREAVERGVDVRIVVSGEGTDLRSIRYLAQKNYGRLLKSGVKIYEYAVTNMHAKSVVADGIFTMIGSANFDGRTFNYNYESNLIVFDEKIAMKMEQVFAEDLKHTREINYHEWEKRPVKERFLEQLFGVVEGWM